MHQQCTETFLRHGLLVAESVLDEICEYSTNELKTLFHSNPKIGLPELCVGLVKEYMAARSSGTHTIELSEEPSPLQHSPPVHSSSSVPPVSDTPYSSSSARERAPVFSQNHGQTTALLAPTTPAGPTSAQPAANTSLPAGMGDGFLGTASPAKIRRSTPVQPVPEHVWKMLLQMAFDQLSRKEHNRHYKAAVTSEVKRQIQACTAAGVPAGDELVSINNVQDWHVLLGSFMGERGGTYVQVGIKAPYFNLFPDPRTPGNALTVLMEHDQSFPPAAVCRGMCPLSPKCCARTCR